MRASSEVEPSISNPPGVSWSDEPRGEHAEREEEGHPRPDDPPAAAARRRDRGLRTHLGGWRPRRRSPHEPTFRLRRNLQAPAYDGPHDDRRDGPPVRAASDPQRQRPARARRRHGRAAGAFADEIRRAGGSATLHGAVATRSSWARSPRATAAGSDAVLIYGHYDVQPVGDPGAGSRRRSSRRSAASTSTPAARATTRATSSRPSSRSSGWPPRSAAGARDVPDRRGGGDRRGPPRSTGSPRSTSRTTSAIIWDGGMLARGSAGRRDRRARALLPARHGDDRHARRAQRPLRRGGAERRPCAHARAGRGAAASTVACPMRSTRVSGPVSAAERAAWAPDAGRRAAAERGGAAYPRTPRPQRSSPSARSPRRPSTSTRSGAAMRMR